MSCFQGKYSVFAACAPAAILFICLASAIQAQVAPVPPPDSIRGRMEPGRLSAPAPAPTPEMVMSARTFIPPPTHEKVVGIVDSRYMTKSDLDARVNRLVFLADRVPVWKEGEQGSKEKLRARLEHMVLYEWARLSLLAIEAQQQNFSVGPEDVDKEKKRIAEAAQRDEQGNVIQTAPAALSAMGIPEDELRGYIRDAILADRLIRHQMAVQVSDDDYRMVYGMYPQEFYEPPAVHLNYMSVALTGEESMEERRRLKRTLEQTVKSVKKGDFLEAAKDFNDPLVGQRGGDYGWATAQSLPQPEKVMSERGGYLAYEIDTSLIEDVFDLKVGEISKILSCEYGFYVFQLVEFKKPEGATFEQAKDNVFNALYDAYKEKIIAEALPKHLMFLNAEGLNVEEIQKQLSMTPEEREAKILADSEQRFREFQEEREARAKQAQGSTAGDSNDPWAIPASKEALLSRAAKEDPTRLTDPLKAD